MKNDFISRTFSTSTDEWVHLATYTIPKKCPHCDVPNSPVRRGYYISGYNDAVVQIFIWCCTNCGKHYITLHSRKDSSDKALQFLAIYPHTKEIEFSEHIKTLSPRFVEIYNESAASEQLGNLTVAGIGYRLALEILVKDYAIKELSVDSKKAAETKLETAIKEFLPGIDIKYAADVVRMKGNDYSHYHEKYDSVDFETFKEYLDIFIQTVDVYLKMNHPPLKRKGSLESASDSARKIPSNDQN
ncbi:hypothetical protein [Eubacterium limosum]|uniref:DUF4145 domain-containing protein n=1 Tax=Eubacterium limosum TaxID=1736 RepID=A0ABT5UUU0_EUBLI|nr:hypothetical protein [Eubacterium limosum]MDE1472725.1 hypothetical protein [Eubacterium limosum]